MPSSWKWTTVGDIAESNIGLTYKPTDICDNGIPVYRSNNIQNRRIDKTDLVRVGTRILDKQFLAIGDLLICARNGSRRLVGKCALIEELTEPTSFGAFMAVCRSVYNPWICLLLNTNYFDRYLDDSNSATINQVTQTMLLAFKIPFPPKNEQERIIKEVHKWLNIIDEVENGSERLKAFITATKSKILDIAIHGKLVPQDPTDEPASELLKRINPKAEITCDNRQYGKLPSGWCETILGNVGTWQSGATPSRLRKDYYGGNIPWLKTGDLNDGIISLIPERITEKALEETSVKLNPKGSVLIAMYGATIGKIGILSIPATTNQACCACVDYKIDQMFLFYFLLANRDNFIAMGGGGAQPNISKEKIINTHISIPPINEQHRIVAKIEELFAQLDTIEASL